MEASPVLDAASRFLFELHCEKSHEVGGRDGLHALHVLSDLPLSAGNLRLRGIRVAGDAPVGTEVENAGQADALRIGYGSDRRRPPALRREVLSDRHSLP